MHKFPSTPHLAWLGRHSVRDDKVFSPAGFDRFLYGPVVVEEKVDWANLGLSFDATGKLRFQNRGNWLEGKLTGKLAAQPETAGPSFPSLPSEQIPADS